MPGNLSSMGLGGVPSTKAVINAFSAGGVSVVNTNAMTSTNAAKEYLSGALTATVLKTLVSLTAPGQASFLSAYAKDATARTIRLVVIADGVTVFDATSNSISLANTGMLAAGHSSGASVGPGNPIRWNSTLVVQVASSLTETDKVAVGLNAN